MGGCEPAQALRSTWRAFRPPPGLGRREDIRAFSKLALELCGKEEWCDRSGAVVQRPRVIESAAGLDADDEKECAALPPLFVVSFVPIKRPLVPVSNETRAY